MKKLFSLTALMSILNILSGYADVQLEIHTPKECVKILKLNERQILINEDGYILYGTLVDEDYGDALVAFSLIRETSKAHKMTFDYAPEVLTYNKFTKIKAMYGYHVIVKATRI